jgi:transcriptional regulator with XRE-family HTH domain
MTHQLERIFGSIKGSDWKKEAEKKYQNPKTLKRSQAIAIEILDYLHHNKVTQKEFASQLGVSPQLINKWLKGSENFTLETIEKIERVLGFDLIELPGCEESTPIQKFLPKELEELYATPLVQRITREKPCKVVSMNFNSSMSYPLKDKKVGHGC